MAETKVTERDFLIRLGLAAFNQQYSRKIAYSDCDIRSISSSRGSDISYEINTVRSDDHVRLRMHLRFGNIDRLVPYRLEVDGTAGAGALGDEVFVTIGTINKDYKTNGSYKFATMAVDDDRLPAVLFNDGTAILLENGDYLELEET